MKRSFGLFVVILSLLVGLGVAVSPARPAAAARDAGVTLVNSEATGPVSRFDVNGNALDAHDALGRDQSSGLDGFHHYCDVAGNVVREQGFTPSRTGELSTASVTTFHSGTPNAPLTLSVVDAATGTVLNQTDFAAGAVPWAPTVLTAHPGITVQDGHQYLLRIGSATATGCYGWEYNDGNPYAGGEESYSTDNGGTFTAESGRDLEFTTDVDDYPNLAAAFDNAGVSPAANPAAADLDGTGHSLVAEDLVAAGWAPGAAVTVNGTPLQFPAAAAGAAGNVVANGQRITMQGSGAALSFLVTSTGTATSGSGVIDYADGTSQSYQLAAPDWYFGPTDARTVSVPRWNAPGGPAAVTVKLYTLVVPLKPGLPVARVTLPKVSDSVSAPAMHVFSLGIRPSTAPWTATWANGIDDTLAPWTWTDRTLRMVEHTSVGGSAVRIRLDNSFGPAPITVGHATIAVQKSGAQPVNTPVTLTFGGAQSVTMSSGGQAVSDGLPFAVPADTNLLVTLYLKGAVTYAPMHSVASQDMYSTNDGTGDHAGDGAEFPVNNLFGFWTVLSGIDVSGGANASVVAFGDSITDGYDSSQNSNSRWPNFLARRLPSGPGVVDEGISGNRILTDAFNGTSNSGSAGVSGLSRLDRDLVAQSGVRTAIVLEGINDINGGATADQVIDGLKQMAATIHAAHLRVLVGTLTPIAGCGCSNDQHIAYRDQVNAFIRANGGVFDGVVDFDAAVRDPANPEAMLAAYDSGDHLHPSDAGYRAMADAVPLSAL